MTISFYVVGVLLLSHMHVYSVAFSAFHLFNGHWNFNYISSLNGEYIHHKTFFLNRINSDTSKYEHTRKTKMYPKKIVMMYPNSKVYGLMRSPENHS